MLQTHAIIPHLIELRRRSIQILLWFSSLFIVFFFLANELFQTLVNPLLHTLSAQDSLIATHVTSPVFTPLKLAANVALLLSVPYALFHVWRFISPGLYPKEQNILYCTIILSMLLFAAGVLFCFYLVLPSMFYLFAHALPKGVRYMPEIAYVLDFITRMLLLFGLCFQVPLVCWTLVRLTLIQVSTLKKLRPYIIVGAFIIGMLLTPPDVFSQIMLAIPLCLLYEIGIILAVYLG